MQDLEYTPSIYFPEQTNQKNNLSADLFFELTSNHKPSPIPLHDLTPSIINLEEKVELGGKSKIKTQEFFQEFQNNFVVTFEDQRGVRNEENGKVASEHSDEEKVESQLGQQNQSGSLHELTSTQFTFVPQKRRDSLAETAKIGHSMLHTAPISISIQKGSPVSFQVKKRTCFKAKENIISNHHSFKLTKKKIINQDIFQQFTTKSKSCSSSTMPNNSKVEEKRDEKKVIKLLQVDFSMETHSYCNFVLDGKQIRERFRSATLNNWKKRFNIQKKSMQDRTAKRENIFHNPLSLR